MGLSRSEQMSRIRGADTGPEIRLRKALWASGLRYRLHDPSVKGRPDVIFKGPRVAVFVDGCYWHGCPDHYVLPRSRQDFWLKKLGANVARDRRQTATLEDEGWTVVRVWEHEVFEDLEGAVRRVEQAVRQGKSNPPDRWRVTHVDVIDPDADLERRHLITLRDPERSRTVERERSTAKCRLPDE